MASQLGLRRMGASGTQPSRTNVAAAYSLPLLYILNFAMLSQRATGLQYVPGSKCASVCGDSTAGTLTTDVVCLDKEYSTQPGSFLRDCISCELNSTAVDRTTNVTDVQWGLFNLRYALSNCMFAYPIERVSISSPCQVTCAPLEGAIKSGISNTSDIANTAAGFNYCTAGQFDDTVINNCAFCYSFIPQQLFLGNFLQALHIACHSAPTIGNTFYPDGRTIFNESTIAGPAASRAVASVSTGLTGWKLALAIVLPIVGGIIILLGSCYCCWHFTSKRRQKMAASGRMSRFHDNQNVASGGLYSPMTSRTTATGTRPQWNEMPTEMDRIVVAPKFPHAPQQKSPGLAQGRWSHHGDDEAGTPLNSADRANFASDQIGPAPGQRKDPELHEHFIGVATSTGAVPGQFHAQDGYARDF